MITYQHSRCSGQENLCYFRGITKSFYNQKNYAIHSIFSILLRKKKRIHIKILGRVPNTKHYLIFFCSLDYKTLLLGLASLVAQ